MQSLGGRVLSVQGKGLASPSSKAGQGTFACGTAWLSQTPSAWRWTCKYKTHNSDLYAKRRGRFHEKQEEF